MNCNAIKLTPKADTICIESELPIKRGEIIFPAVKGGEIDGLAVARPYDQYTMRRLSANCIPSSGLNPDAPRQLAAAANNSLTSLVTVGDTWIRHGITVHTPYMIEVGIESNAPQTPEDVPYFRSVKMMQWGSVDPQIEQRGRRRTEGAEAPVYPAFEGATIIWSDEGEPRSEYAIEPAVEDQLPGQHYIMVTSLTPSYELVDVISLQI